MPLPLMLIAAGVSAAGSLFQGATALSGARARSKALKAQGRQALNEAGVAAQAGLEDDERTMARAMTMAAQGAGGGPGGSALDVLRDLERQSAFRAQNTIYRAGREADNAEREARVSRTEGINAMVSSTFKAGSSLLAGFSDFAGSRAEAAGGAARARRGMTTVY